MEITLHVSGVSFDTFMKKYNAKIAETFTLEQVKLDELFKAMMSELIPESILSAPKQNGVTKTSKSKAEADSDSETQTSKSKAVTKSKKKSKGSDDEEGSDDDSGRCIYEYVKKPRAGERCDSQANKGSKYCTKHIAQMRKKEGTKAEPKGKTASKSKAKDTKAKSSGKSKKIVTDDDSFPVAPNKYGRLMNADTGIVVKQDTETGTFIALGVQSPDEDKLLPLGKDDIEVLELYNVSYDESIVSDSKGAKKSSKTKSSGSSKKKKESEDEEEGSDITLED
jgi:hypothetical protein